MYLFLVSPYNFCTQYNKNNDNEEKKTLKIQCQNGTMLCKKNVVEINFTLYVLCLVIVASMTYQNLWKIFLKTKTLFIEQQKKLYKFNHQQLFCFYLIKILLIFFSSNSHMTTELIDSTSLKTIGGLCLILYYTQFVNILCMFCISVFLFFFSFHLTFIFRVLNFCLFFFSCFTCLTQFNNQIRHQYGQPFLF